MDTTDTSLSSLVQELRTQTQSLHRELEATTGASKLPQGTFTLPEYFKLLYGNLALHRSIEDQLEQRLSAEEITAFGLPWSHFSASLQGDLEILAGRPVTAPEAHPIPSRPALIGALYVALGSTLGGKRILKWIRKIPEIHESQATQYYQACEQVPPRAWPQFCSACDHLNLSSAEREEVIQGALLAFAFIKSQIAQAPAFPT